MGKNTADIKLTANSGIELPLPNPKDAKRVLILGNTIGFFGYPGKGCNISNIHGEDAKRFAWMYNCALLGIELEILGEEEEFDYYSDLFQKIKERYGYKANTTFTVMKCNDDYDRKLNEYIEEMEDTGKKRFDYAIMNPPYDRNLHLKFLEKVIPVADKVVNISPVRWLQDPFAKYLKTSDYKKFEESISKKIETLDIIDAKTASTIFDAGFTMNLGIYVCGGNGGYNYDMETPLIKKIIEKTNENSWLTYAYTKQYNKPQKSFILKIGSFGGSAKTDLAVLTNTTYQSQLKTKEPNVTAHNACNYTLVSFDTEKERHNFYDCYNHRFMKWHTKLWKADVGIRTSSVPYFGDYTKQWTTKMFCEYFDITGYIDDEHAVPGSEWEEIMNQW